MFQNRYSMFSDIRKEGCNQGGYSCRHVILVNDGIGKCQQVPHFSVQWANVCSVW